MVKEMGKVHKNIDVFGGDPGRITLFGESAGAASVILQGLKKLKYDSKAVCVIVTVSIKVGFRSDNRNREVTYLPISIRHRQQVDQEKKKERME
ncbi:unnamed protein product [Haemonchus placei]|uniref:Carboxylic ester hydrolase n=1 Tax=Haemonchus placei TaxID=6290 RepID=A0A0N4W7H2_HAEPC|nr:unnamed protein product [Haemonchus placei]